jgi:hypothetical protein
MLYMDRLAVLSRPRSVCTLRISGFIICRSQTWLNTASTWIFSCWMTPISWRRNVDGPSHKKGNGDWAPSQHHECRSLFSLRTRELLLLMTLLWSIPKEANFPVQWPQKGPFSHTIPVCSGPWENPLFSYFSHTSLFTFTLCQGRTLIYSPPPRALMDNHFHMLLCWSVSPHYTT